MESRQIQIVWPFMILARKGGVRSTYLLALCIRKFLERFSGQPAHAGLQVRDGDAFGAFQIV